MAQQASPKVIGQSDDFRASAEDVVGRRLDDARQDLAVERVRVLDFDRAQSLRLALHGRSAGARRRGRARPCRSPLPPFERSLLPGVDEAGAEHGEEQDHLEEGGLADADES